MFVCNVASDLSVLEIVNLPLKSSRAFCAIKQVGQFDPMEVSVGTEWQAGLHLWYIPSWRLMVASSREAGQSFTWPL